jgi:hypothetical protein
MLLPAIQAVREAARRVSCQRNLSQLILAVHNYQSLHGFYPPGTIDSGRPIRNVRQGYHHNWIVQILPYIEQRNAWSHIDRSVGVYDPANAPVAAMTLELLRCPSQPRAKPPQTCYAAMHHDREAPIDVDNNGVFFLNSRVRYEDVTDGVSQTIFLGEVLAENGGLGWMSGTRASLRNAGIGLGTRGMGGPGAAANASNMVDAVVAEVSEVSPEKKLDRELVVGTFTGPHTSGSAYAFGDGRVAFLGGGSSPKVFRQLAHRADGKLLDEDAF